MKAKKGFIFVFVLAALMILSSLAHRISDFYAGIFAGWGILWFLYVISEIANEIERRMRDETV